MGLNEAFTHVQARRFCVNPNEGFMAQLREYEPIYRAAHVVPLPLPQMAPLECPQPARGSQKRRIGDDSSDDEDGMDTGESAPTKPNLSQQD